jgi:hypothetical protein
MFLSLTRRQWLRNLLAAVSGFWVARRALARPRPASTRPALKPRPAPVAPGCCRVTTYTYDAAGRLAQVEGPWVITFVYDAVLVVDHG